MMWRRASRVSDEELDWAIRDALRAETEGLEPSPQVWARVRARIAEGRPAQERRARDMVWYARLANVIQGAVLAVLVLGFGLGLSRGFLAPGWNQSTALSVPTATYITKPVGRYPKDVLNAKRLMQIDQQKPAPGAWRLPQ
ncbi:MAG: hypothetical protein ACPL7R_01975 [Anaerolineae bacterium]